MSLTSTLFDEKTHLSPIIDHLFHIRTYLQQQFCVHLILLGSKICTKLLSFDIRSRTKHKSNNTWHHYSLLPRFPYFENFIIYSLLCCVVWIKKLYKFKWSKKDPFFPKHFLGLQIHPHPFHFFHTPFPFFLSIIFLSSYLKLKPLASNPKKQTHNKLHTQLYHLNLKFETS